jgi:cell division protein FtsZ
MREYNEVGQTVAEFAADDANIKIGTVLDMDLEDEIRVTVVATGLNRGAQRAPVDAFAGAPMRNNFRVVRGTEVEAPIAAAQPQPTIRPQQVRRFGSNGGNGASASAGQSAAETEYDYLDIPAFLRRQAD